ncbi:hypothetical protein [Helicobacter zhangjianzhongii]|uniref:Uncharacterized protein n=1 Tax=Helicobacter zhangjianzhongii TaxID=2974574 RepID=A0ACC6FU60_9HELI|nr:MULTISPECIES: hypothetical protein [unclassified Helicobacter]MDL0080523.1 hypothetical protein [Helicobacter sp. CPD2-1]MDL0082836.1 hypothetical protein [Helicobacter sp. XJK30-2]
MDSRSEAKILKTPQAAGFLVKKRGCAAFCAEIRLMVYRTSKRQTPRFFAKSQRQNKKVDSRSCDILCPKDSKNCGIALLVLPTF